jgi:hypothetical protein
MSKGKPLEPVVPSGMLKVLARFACVETKYVYKTNDSERIVCVPNWLITKISIFFLVGRL